jgi:hypothetical protein
VFITSGDGKAEVVVGQEFGAGERKVSRTQRWLLVNWRDCYTLRGNEFSVFSQGSGRSQDSVYFKKLTADG